MCLIGWVRSPGGGECGQFVEMAERAIRLVGQNSPTPSKSRNWQHFRRFSAKGKQEGLRKSSNRKSSSIIGHRIRNFAATNTDVRNLKINTIWQCQHGTETLGSSVALMQ
jgi:hypothetical protein